MAGITAAVSAMAIYVLQFVYLIAPENDSQAPI